MSYALYKFHKAILSLYETELPRRQWLTSCHIYHILHLQDEDLPKSVRSKFDDLRQILTKVPGCGSTETLERTVEAMNNSEINSVIDHIITIHAAIHQHEQMAASA